MEHVGTVLVIHHAPLVVEVLEMAFSAQGLRAHGAVTFREAKTLLKTLRGVVAVVAYADMPNQPLSGTLMRMAAATHPGAALVVISTSAHGVQASLPPEAVLLREPFDRVDLFAALDAASQDGSWRVGTRLVP